MNGTSSLKTRSNVFPIDIPAWLEALLLISSGTLAVVLHQAFRWPLNLPGHHGIEWIAILMIGRAFSRLGPAGSLTSLGAVGGAALTGWIGRDPFIWLIYAVPGPLVDLAFRSLPRYSDKIWFFMLLGALAHTTKPLIRLIITIASGWSFGSFRFGIVYPVASHFLYGLIGGLLGALLVLGIRKISKSRKG